MKKIAVVGSINTDFCFRCEHLPNPSETISGNGFEIKFGGKGANEAVAIARQGGNVSLFGKVGEDTLSKENLKNLKKEKVETQCIEKSTAGAGVAGIMVDNKTNSIIVVPGANGEVDVEYIERHKKEILEHDIFCLQLEIHLKTTEYLVSMLSKANKTIVFNPSPIVPLKENLLKQCSFVVVNEIEIKKLPHFKSVEQIMKRYNGRLILTCGNDGVYYYSNKKVCHIPAIAVDNVVDTTGAGDTFLGSFALQLADGKTLEEAISYANICAGLKIKKAGAQTGMPTKKEVENFIKHKKSHSWDFFIAFCYHFPYNINI